MIVECSRDLGGGKETSQTFYTHHIAVWSHLKSNMRTDPSAPTDAKISVPLAKATS